MAAGAAGDGLLRGVFEGSISGHDSDIQRRPYHKNCGCALHKSRGGGGRRCSHSPSHVSYPIRRSWSEGCLALAVASSRSPSPRCSATASIARKRHKSMVFSIEEEEQQHEFDGESPTTVIGNTGTAN
ncbi:hypothetical protein DM860_000437 [Cuscuta australis]|nr:hypothetical protein DM860_000437 [Cuscuta australis]